MEVKTTLVVLNSIELYRNMAGENFTHEILYENLNKEAANKIERDLIKKYDSINNGYNIQEGGYTSLTKESLDKMSKSLKQRCYPSNQQLLLQHTKSYYRTGLPKSTSK